MSELRKALADVTSGCDALRPPKRVTVAEGVAQTLVINQPGGYIGPWSAEETPYMVEPMNMLASRTHEAVCFVGPARTGKCLDLDTPIPTPSGWVTMGAIKAGDHVLGPDGKPTRVLAAHDVKHNLPCYRVTFSDGTSVVADGEHLWGVERFYWAAPQWRYEVRSTADMVADLHYGRNRFRYRVRNTGAVRLPDGSSVHPQTRQIVAIEPVESRPVRCIQVDNESHLFLAGEGMVPTHNTMGLLDGWITHAVVNDPGDFAVIQMTQEKAREYSKTRIDRMIRHSPALQALKSSSGQHDNTHDKMFRHGMWLRIAWPTVTNLSGSDYRYVAFTDYDRMPDDIDGEGAPFTLGLKRTTTFLSRGMCMVESSPGRDVADPGWAPVTPHEGPPTGGVLGIYNRSDRRRWYWPCLDCGTFFEAAPGLSLFGLPADDELLEMVREADLGQLATRYAKVVCPHCGSITDQKHKHELNQRGVWLRDGEFITNDGERYGNPITSTIAGYWMGGVAAAYQNWRSLVMRHLQGLRDYALTGEELTLKTTVNTDQGMPYLPRALVEASKNGGQIRQDESMARFHVPDEARFLVAAVDVQGGSNARFVVQVHAVGAHMEQWVVDRYEIKDSKREGVGSDFAPIDPAAYAEDWLTLTEKVVQATYKTSTEGRELQVLMTVVDSGGEDGVTDKAYAWYRAMRQAGLHDRIMLIKGASSKTAPMIRQSLVGQRTSREKGDVPLYMLNPNLLKDAVHAGLRRQTPGPGYIHVPAWVNKAFLDELYRSEVRGEGGVWSQVRKRNEAFDLAAYVRAGCLRLGADKIKNWDKAPAWAQPLATNREAVSRQERIELKEDAVAVPTPVVLVSAGLQRPIPARRRRVVASGYLG